MSLRGHPTDVLLSWLADNGVARAAGRSHRSRCPAGVRVDVPGVVLIRLWLSTASGVVSTTREGEFGIVNLIVRPRVFERYRAVARHAGVLRACGKIEREGKVGRFQAF